MYDVIIVGAGIAGLYCALKILKEHPKTKLAILEKYNYIGGRIVTFRKTLESGKKVQWEIGAGRISGTHERTKRLLKEYGLHLIPISPYQEFRQAKNSFRPEPSEFSKHANIFLEASKSLTPEILRENTIFSIATKILGRTKAEDIFDRFPYWAEPNLMRADLAIQTLQGVVGQEDNFFVCQEGLGALTDAMAENVRKLGGEFFLKTEVNGIQHVYGNDSGNFSGSYDIVSCIRTGKSPNPSVTLKISARKTILALHVEALQKLPQLADAPFLKQLKMSPLIRIYAVFPTEKGKSWFSGIPKTVCPSKDNPIRFFIPVNPITGVTMISYAEGPSADHWIKMVNTLKLEKAVMNAVRKLFPEIEKIPDPLFFKAHPWYGGCSYWIPGEYDVEQAIKDSLNPLPDKLPTTYVCGESTSHCQTWIEGALSSAEMLIKSLRSNT